MKFLEKTRTWMLAAAAGCLVSSPVPAQAEPSGSLQTGKELLRVCQSAKAIHQQACTGYIMGVIDTVLLSSIENPHKKSICIMDKRISYFQARNAVIDHIKNETGNLTKDSPRLIVDALKVKYPCS